MTTGVWSSRVSVGGGVESRFHRLGEGDSGGEGRGEGEGGADRRMEESTSTVRGEVETADAGGGTAKALLGCNGCLGLGNPARLMPLLNIRG
jgi:hypothetical protein